MMHEQHSLVCEGELDRPPPVSTSVFDLVSAKPRGDDVELGELSSTITAWLSGHFHVAANLRGEGVGRRKFVWLLRADSATRRDNAWRAAIAARSGLSAAARTLQLEADLLVQLRSRRCTDP